jgi:hypothetical protein
MICLKNCSALCPLDWVGGIICGHQQIAVTSGEDDATRDEYAAQCFYYRRYVIGRLDMNYSVAYIEIDGKERRYTVYEVLNNAHNCRLRCNNSCCGQIPPNAIGGIGGYENNSYVERTTETHEGMSQSFSLLNFIELSEENLSRYLIS